MTNIVTCPYCLAGIENDSLYCDHCGKELYICPTCKTYGRGKFCRNDGNILVSARQVLPLPETVNSQPQEPILPPVEEPVVLPSEPVVQPKKEAVGKPIEPIDRLSETIVYSKKPVSRAMLESILPPVEPVSESMEPILPPVEEPVSQPIEPVVQPQELAVVPPVEEITLPPSDEPTCPTGHSLLVMRCVMEDITLTLDDGDLIGRRSSDTPQLARYGVVSGRHASVHRLDGRWMITDEGSSNGTWVNGLRLPVGALQPLTPGTTIYIATLDFIVE